MKISRIEPEFVSSFPTPLEPGVLYVSTQFSTAAHLCACGCRREVITPLSPAQWVLTFDGSISVRPSIGNWTFPCRSHYVIDQGTIRWARTFTHAEAASNRDDDHDLLDETRAAPHRGRPSRWRRFWSR